MNSKRNQKLSYHFKLIELEKALKEIEEYKLEVEHKVEEESKVMRCEELGEANTKTSNVTKEALSTNERYKV